MGLIPKTQVLVPIDFSEESFEAVNQTLEAVGTPSGLHVLHVLPKLNAGEPGIMWQTMDDSTRRQNVEAAFAKRYSTPEQSRMHFSVAIGDCSAEILDYAKQHDIRLIVIPAQGRNSVGRFLLGSVAERVVRHAHCPVLVLRQSNS